MSRLLLLAPALVFCTACNESRQVYAESRYAPTSTAEANGPVDRMTRTSPPQTYELPAKAPAKDGNSTERIPGAKPGPQFKPTSMVAWSDEPVRSGRNSDSEPLVGTSLERPSGDDTKEAVVMHGMDTRPGAQPAFTAPRQPNALSGTDARPRPQAASDDGEPQPLSNYNDNYNPYYPHPHAVGTRTVPPEKSE